MSPVKWHEPRIYYIKGMTDMGTYSNLQLCYYNIFIFQFSWLSYREMCTLWQIINNFIYQGSILQYIVFNSVRRHISGAVSFIPYYGYLYGRKILRIQTPSLIKDNTNENKISKGNENNMSNFVSISNICYLSCCLEICLENILKKLDK